MSEFKALVMSWLIALFPQLDTSAPTPYAGYVEADFLYVSATATRKIVNMSAREGTEVAAGAFLFELDDTHEQAALREAIAQRDAAKAELENLSTGSREQEIAVIRAELEQARAEQDLARTNLERSVSLLARGIVSPAKVDADRAALEQANGRVAELEARLALAELPARKELIQAARAKLKAAEAAVDQARAALAELKVFAPEAGLVEKTYYDPGEVLPAGSPAVSLLPQGPRKVLFFVPEPERSQLSIGDALSLSCDGCPAGLTVTITRLASQPQYTPPIIYSRDERTRFVYQAEARLAAEAGLLPGQPVTVVQQK